MYQSLLFSFKELILSQATTKSRQTTLAGSDVRDLSIQHNKLVDDLDRSRNITYNSGGLVIKAGGSTLAKTANAVRYMNAASGTARPVLGLIAANTDVAAFAGSVTNAKFNVFVHTVKDDGAGVQTFATRMGTEGATRAAVVFPAVPANETIYAFTEINPTGAGNFVGATTALDDAGVVPNATYVNVVGEGMVGPTAGDGGVSASKVGDTIGTAVTA